MDSQTESTLDQLIKSSMLSPFEKIVFLQVLMGLVPKVSKIKVLKMREKYLVSLKTLVEKGLLCSSDGDIFTLPPIEGEVK